MESWQKHLSKACLSQCPSINWTVSAAYNHRFSSGCDFSFKIQFWIWFGQSWHFDRCGPKLHVCNKYQDRDQEACQRYFSLKKSRRYCGIESKMVQRELVKMWLNSGHMQQMKRLIGSAMVLILNTFGFTVSCLLLVVSVRAWSPILITNCSPCLLLHHLPLRFLIFIIFLIIFNIFNI